ncbi:LOW QUALITY PROTEIN: Hypothetical protein PHPALM_5914 [Phytophthora palmivora]|uniref:Uncharacterized protein n=1 Tax=Phytophthora palmivora TaxID=4796 RepID=A0A2P4YGH7_9STRA|nr:LOW QUALITY PROTEIN: Hypothetical protein PHPALM_5914 [Phytophthora palmivora]
MDSAASTCIPNASATQVTASICRIQSGREAFQRLLTVIGEVAVASMIRTLPPTDQHGVALGSIMREQRDAVASKPVLPSVTPRAEHLKLHVSSCMGREDLSPLIELDLAISAQSIAGLLSKVAFAMSCLGGRARSCAYGHCLTDPTCFSTYEALKEEIYLPTYPSTVEAATTLAMQEEFSLRLAKRHVNVSRPQRPLVKQKFLGPMDHSNAAANGQQLNYDASIADTSAITHASVRRPYTQVVVDATMAGIVANTQKTPVGVGRPTRSAVTRVYNGHAGMEAVAPSERDSHCNVQDDKSNLVILKVMTKSERAGSLRLLVDSGASSNFVRHQSLPLLDFEEVKIPRRRLELRLVTGAVVKTEKRVIWSRFSYKHWVFLEAFIVLVMGDKLWCWACRDLHGMTQRSTGKSVRSYGSGVTTRQRAMVLSVWHMHHVVHSNLLNRQRLAPLSPVVARQGRELQLETLLVALVFLDWDQTLRRKFVVKRRGDNSASNPGVDTTSISTSRGDFAERRRGDKDASTPVVDAASSADGYNRPAPKKLASCPERAQAGLDDSRPRIESAGDTNEDLSTAGSGHKTSVAEFHKKQKCKRLKLRKPRSRTEASQQMSAGQTKEPTIDVETLNILTRTYTEI